MKKPLVNNQIRASRVRVIDETGKQLGVFNLGEAFEITRNHNLDLVQITEKVDPPVCKLIDYGKYLYLLEKKEKKTKTKIISGIKGIRIGFNISLHDLKTRTHQAEKFLKKGYKVKVELPLKGREKAHAEFAKEKMNQFLEDLKKLTAIKTERELKREPRGFTMIIAKTRE